MFIGNYAATKPYVCMQCRGKGCSNCDNRGIKVRNLQVISEEPIDSRHIQVQAHLKPISGHIVEDKECTKENLKLGEKSKKEENGQEEKDSQ